MTKKIALISSSHGGAMRLGWDILKNTYQDKIDIDFFCSPGTAINQVDYQEDRITPKNQKLADQFKITSGGKETIMLADYDAFVVHGMPLPIHPLFNMIVQTKYANRGQFCSQQTSSCCQHHPYNKNRYILAIYSAYWRKS